MDVNKFVDNLRKETTKVAKNNKGALIGAVVGLFLTDNKQAQSALLGAVTGSLLVDKKEEKTNE